jgi:hypothetical protein
MMQLDNAISYECTYRQEAEIAEEVSGHNSSSEWRNVSIVWSFC